MQKEKFNNSNSFFKISLAEFSFATDLWSGKMTNLDFPSKAKRQFGIEAIEYVSAFFNDSYTDKKYMTELKKRADDENITNHLIMVDGENISDLDAGKRKKAVELHYPWVDAARFLGCQSIRVNLGDMNKPGTADDEMDAAVDGYGQLLEYGEKAGINIIVENHHGRSCNPQWLIGIMKQVNHPRAGTLPDFGNFCINRTKQDTNDMAGWMKTMCLKEYDRYKGLQELMPYAKGISAKSIRFNKDGEEADMDYKKLFTIINSSGFKGYAGIEYAGGLFRSINNDETYLSNDDGVIATKKLLEKVRVEVD